MRVNLTVHALDRYTERVKPWLSRKEADAEIRRLIGEPPEIKPDCDYIEDGGGSFDAYIELAPGITLGCRADSPDQVTAVTTMIRTGQTSRRRASKRHEKRVRKQRSRAQKNRERMARRYGHNKREEITE